MVRIVLYLNQFFGQLGGEEAAAEPPRLVTDAIIGPGRALGGLLEADETLVGTLICGDSYFADQPEAAAATCLDLIRPLEPDMVLAGPAFNAGRYGVACGTLAEVLQQQLGATVVSGMYAENPAVELYRKQVVIVKTGLSAATMRDTLKTMLTLARKLRRGETLLPEADGYFSQGRAMPAIAEKPAAERAIAMLLEKLRGQPYRTEVVLPRFSRTLAPSPLSDLRDKVVALVTDGGLVPAGNPDNIESFAATRWGTYDIAGADRLAPEDYEVSHGGYDNRFVRQDPHRLVPLDAAREMERNGQIGRLFDKFVSTTGLSNPIDNSRRLGREIAEYLRQQGVEAVILTST